jgi:hypothetical protein
MCDKRHDEAESKPEDHVDRERIIQLLSLEYQTLREDLLVRTSGRFQFLGLMTTAAALFATGIFGHSAFGSQSWIAATLAFGVSAFGLVCFLRLGHHMVTRSTRLAEIERRINALVPAEPGFSTVLSWNSDHQQRRWYQR